MNRLKKRGAELVRLSGPGVSEDEIDVPTLVPDPAAQVQLREFAEAVLALEMGADVEDIALTVHPHPTLSETFNFAAEVAEGTCTDIYIPKR